MPTLIAVLQVAGFKQGARIMVDSAMAITHSLVDAQMQMQAMENTLITATGSLEGSRTEIEYLYEFADKLGASFTGAVIPYAKLASSVQDMATSDLHSVFEGFQTALVATHASTETVNNSFLALQQIASKGKLNMQDLRRQFAEHIPGAMRTFADAMDMTMDQFNKAVHDGSINVNEFLIKSAGAFKNKFGPAAEEASRSLQAEINRLSAGWLKYRADILEASEANDSFAATVRNVNSSLNELKDNKAIEEALSGWAQLAEQFTLTLKPMVNDTATATGIMSASFSSLGSGALLGFNLMSMGADEFLGVLAQVVGSEELADKVAKHYNETSEATVKIANDLSGETEKLAVRKEELHAAYKREEAARQAGIDAAEKEYALDIRMLKAADDMNLRAEELHKQEMDRYTKEAAAAEEAAKKKIEALKKEAEARFALVTEIYTKTGAMEEEYFAGSIANIKAQAELWVAAGMEITEANQWVDDSIRTLKGELTDEEYAVQENAEAAAYYAAIYGDDVVVAQESATEAVDGMTAAVNEQAESVGQSSYAYESVADAMNGYGQAVTDTSSILLGFRITEANAAKASIAATKAIWAAKEEANNAERERLATSWDEWNEYNDDVLKAQEKVTDEISSLEDKKAKKHIDILKLQEKLDKEYASSQGKITDSTRASLDLAVSEYNKIGQELESEVARQRELASALVKASQTKSSITQAAGNLTSRGGNSVSSIFGGGSQRGGGVNFYFNQNISRSDVNNITSQQTRNASR